MSLRNFSALPAAQSVRRIPFDSADVISGFAGGYFLVVGGQAPCLNMNVYLSPLIYIECPDYWQIEVIGSLPGSICLTAMKPFVVTIPLVGITGYKGVEVVGAATSRKFEVPGGCEQGASRD